MNEEREDLNQLKRKQIKICGLRTVDDIRYCNEALPDYVGFVLFFPKSKRNISLEHAKALITDLDGRIKKVAVTVSPTMEQIKQVEQGGFDYIQIHGELKMECYEAATLPIIRAFQVADIPYYEKQKNLHKIIGYVFDAASPGSGETFDWTRLFSIKRDKKLLFLAGGIHEHNVLKAMKQVNPDVIDVSSSVENIDAKGHLLGKDKKKIKQIVRMVHNEK